MLKIKWQGNFYEVPEDELSLYPGYEMASDEEFNNVGKLNDPVQENTAIAGSVNTSSMDFTSDPGSLVLPKIPKPIGSELDNLTIDDINYSPAQLQINLNYNHGLQSMFRAEFVPATAIFCIS